VHRRCVELCAVPTPSWLAHGQAIEETRLSIWLDEIYGADLRHRWLGKLAASRPARSPLSHRDRPPPPVARWMGEIEARRRTFRQTGLVELRAFESDDDRCGRVYQARIAHLPVAHFREGRDDDCCERVYQEREQVRRVPDDGWPAHAGAVGAPRPV
jgi:hypothetical protein